MPDKETNPIQTLREKNKDTIQFIYWEQAEVVDWFYKGQIVWIEDIRDTIPEGQPHPEDKEFFMSYACRVWKIDAYTVRIIEGKYLEKLEREAPTALEASERLSKSVK